MIESFISYQIESKGASLCTLKAYRQDLQAFALWAKAQDPKIRWSLITKGFIEAYRNELRQQGFAVATIKRKVSALRSFYRWQQSQFGFAENPAKYVETPKAPKPLPSVVSRDEVFAVLRVCDRQTAALIVLLYSTGLRLGEALSVRVGDINKAERSITVWGKGSKQRKVFYPAEAVGVLNAYAKGKSGCVFAELEPRTARQLVVDAFAVRGLHVSPHILRHSFASAMLSNGCDLFTIGKLLGHSQLSSTQRYTHLALSQEQTLFNRFNPFAS